eukprot:CAMPEP_0170207036 /NCGR_PEP_ID=MMETSP0116_2-20130129/3088_1 /TAXON_ID=400756 /ORGANISM="Durinskia baltica, Strain CSIRO CS-38" /LENGTH=338 /DNA_ID=CAMNT_0010457479 /DNA_START=217 /DNA_END=1233 /DNA_ORIENTATION=-
MTGIQEQACIDAAKRMTRVAVPVPSDISPSGSVGISYIHWPADKSKRSKNSPPLLLIHGFDSSGLEYRRLGPKLAAKGIDTYAVDILGWGFTQYDGVSSFSADSKVKALENFVNTMFGKETPFCIAGASLGGAAAIELAAVKQGVCAGLILIDAQGFVDGVGPMAKLPTPLAKLGVGVLKSIPLRNSANQMSYYDKETFATEEAQVIGRLHCLRDGWDDAMVSFMQSGGFSPSSKIPLIQSPSLVLWGRQDGILEGKEYANQFVETLPNARLVWIEECGHVPHLEQPETTASAIAEFFNSDVETQVTSVQQSQPTYLVGAGFVGALAISQVLNLLASQ